MGTNPRKKLITLNEFLKDNSSKIIGGLGLGGGIRTLYRPLSILREKERAIKKEDLWILNEIHENYIIVKNKINGKTIKIDKKFLISSLRRHSNINYIDITNKNDYLITENFDKIDNYLDDDKILKKFINNLDIWKNYIKTRKGNIFIIRKYDISAKGTSLLCFYSETPTVPGEFWIINPLTIEDAKILSLWLNSTPNLIQLLINRTEQRGAWMKNDIKTLKENYILNPNSLNNEEKNEILNIFEQVANKKFQSILRQFELKDVNRMLIDKCIFKILNYNENEIEQIINNIYPNIENEIVLLKKLMK